MSKFGKKVFTPTDSGVPEEGVYEKSEGFIRSKKDNPLLKSLQLEGNFFDIISLLNFYLRKVM